MNIQEQLIDETYQIVTTGKLSVWPKTMDIQSRQVLITSLIQWYEEKQQFDKCRKLKLVYKQISNDDKA